MTSRIKLEAPVFNLETALEAARVGVDRIELCANFQEGGDTPSAGMVKFLKLELAIPIFVMIRPRGGDFVYTEKELEVMRQDIEILGEFGADGFVFGALDIHGKVAKKACETLLQAASGKPCTFHRAFDSSSDCFDALHTIIDLGFNRILTSGGKNTVTEGLDVIKQLLSQAKDRIIIIPGGGTKPEHVVQLSETGFLKEVHASCKTYVPSPNQYINPDLSFSDDPYSFTHRLGIDPEIVAQFKKVMEK